MSDLELLQLEAERRDRERASKPLIDFVPALTPHWDAPTHLAPLTQAFEEVERREVRLAGSTPPQHGKTETILHGCARYLRRHPERTIAYCSYAAQIAHSKSRIARQYAVRAGVDLVTDAVHEWRTSQGGGFIATGIGGVLTSQAVQLLIVDDPHENRESVESELQRSKVEEWFSSVAMTRLHPGSSVIVIHTRWHEDDLIGRLSKKTHLEGTARGGQKIWEQFNLPAINERGEILWSKRRTRDFYDAQRANSEYDWWSLWQGSPRPRGAQLFEGSSFYETPPSEYAIGIGIDGAYSTKTRADYCVAVVMARVGKGPTAKFYVLRVVRKQCGIKAFRKDVAALCRAYNSAAWWYVGGQEKELADFMSTASAELQADGTYRITDEGANIVGIRASVDKYVRAQPYAAAWNDGRVFLLQGAEWVPAYLAEHHGFPASRYDDQVDAGAAAFDMASNAALTGKRSAFTTESYDDLNVGI